MDNDTIDNMANEFVDKIRSIIDSDLSMEDKKKEIAINIIDNVIYIMGIEDTEYFTISTEQFRKSARSLIKFGGDIELLLLKGRIDE